MPITETTNEFLQLIPQKNRKKSLLFLVTSFLSVLFFFYLYSSRGINNQKQIVYATVPPPICKCDIDVPPPIRPCDITIIPDGRLGNLMGQYATLYSLAKLNNRSACIHPQMSAWLRPYFHQLSLPTLENFTLWEMRNDYGLHDWMSDEYRHIPSYPFIDLTGYPNSWTFYHHIRDEIVKEFQFNRNILANTHKILKSFNATDENVTFVGIHVRRSDYVGLMNNNYRGVVAQSGFFQQAMDYFNEKYNRTAFLVVSDDMEWCRNNINNSLGNVHFVGNRDVSSPAYDLALMAHCNHSIIDIGTFGIWGAYLAGGETVYLTNFTLPDSPFLDVLKYNATYMPDWIPIAADLNPIMELLNITGYTHKSI